jgi:hypothetical protein
MQHKTVSSLQRGEELLPIIYFFLSFSVTGKEMLPKCIYEFHHVCPHVCHYIPLTAEQIYIKFYIVEFHRNLSKLPNWLKSDINNGKRTTNTQKRTWFRHYATNRKVAGSIPDELTGIFN